MRTSVLVLAVLLVAFASPAQATFPGRNGLLAFSAYNLNEESDDVLIQDTFVGIAHLPRGPRRIFAIGSRPAFSPDGRTIAYQQRSGGGIWLTRPGCRWPFDSDSPPPCSRLRHLTRGWDESPAWSANGRRIAFERYFARIYTVDALGRGLRFVAQGSDPDWSPSGALAFTSRDGAGLRVRDPQGHTRPLTTMGAEPSWAPAGGRLAFRGWNAETGKAALYVVNADGTGLRVLWESAKAATLSPTWSPDGRSIAFIWETGPDFTRAVYVTRANGRGEPRVLMPRLPNCRACFKNLMFGALAWQPLRR
jgi:Tol biopolymer transport system component